MVQTQEAQGDVRRLPAAVHSRASSERRGARFAKTLKCLFRRHWPFIWSWCKRVARGVVGFYLTAPIIGVWISGLISGAKAFANRDPFLACAAVVVVTAGHLIFTYVRRTALRLLPE
jgi:hypothetical protein